MYVTIVGKGDDADKDFKVEQSGDGSFSVTDMETGTSTSINVGDIDYSHNSLLKMGDTTLQLMHAENDLKFDFYYMGGKVETLVYDESQYKYKQHMAPPVKIDTTKSLLSPMPGAIVSVSVEPGQTIVDGQELCVVEAMKMQNILKSERDGKVKSVQVKAGDSVAVDQLLIEFE